MGEHARNFMIGLVTILGLSALVVLLMLFGELRLFGRPEYTVTIYMTLAAGMREGSPIELNGVRIGRVESVALVEHDVEFPVRVNANIEQDKRIPTSVHASVDRSLLAGSAVLQLVSQLPEDERMTYIPDDGSGELYVVARTFIDDVMAELDARTEPLLDALESFNRLSATYTALGTNLNDLIGDLADGEDEASLRSAITKLNEVLSEARAALRLANTWLDDEQLRADITRAVTNANTLIETATETFEHYGRLAESMEGDVSALMRNLMPVTDELAATLDEVRRLTRLATEGEGTVAQLLNNPDLYESLVDASQRLERALIEAQLLIQKFQTEGVPVQW